ncbi:hypothetical protein EXIGLDRAFT_750120 [Exidia glandulosa HHB12029]|uniref:Uncharacterized protein n=1 Tax=Exidia glandulosa HHB12029 TaxID=1314781 RepID=A0A165H6F9_EXIGL|nr:hypothetical protein EXIGLDRAFT_750120 [Exidia glandulosa HHB12029]
MARDSVSRHDLPWGPSTLVTDINGSANVKQPRAKDEAENFREVTGTDMFISCDLSDPGSVSYVNDSASLPFALADLDEHPKGPDALAAAFLNQEDIGFLDMINRVVPAEAQRRLRVRRGKSAPPAAPNGLHQPRHDVESLFWVHLWGGARAQPQNVGFTHGDQSNFNGFCATMLRHRIRGGNKEAGRVLYLSPQPLDRELFHPRFQRVQELFLQMTLYLTIPWHVYEDDPYIKEHPDHAHVAFRRLLLGMLVRDDMPELDDLLNTEGPRLIDEGKSHLGRSATSAKTPEPLSVIMEKKKEPNPSTQALASTSQVSTLSQKRAREDTQVDDRAAKKMRVDVEHEQDIPPLAVDTPKTVTEDPLQVDEGKDDTASLLDLKTQRYIAAIRVHQPLQTVNALRLEKWKDKAHWFGKGKLSPPTKESAA